MQPIAFIAAMSQEVRPFLRLVGVRQRDTMGRFALYRFELCGRRCVLVETGVGIARATDATRALLSSQRPAFALSFGIAGAPMPGLEVGDVLAASSLRRLENGRLSPARSLAHLPDAAFEEVEQALRRTGANLSRGTVITTWAEQTMVPEDDHQGPLALEMETAGIADVCAQARIPLYSLRAVSDSVSEPLPFNLADFVDDRQQVMAGKLAVAVLKRPSLLPSLLRLNRNAHRAAENAAVAALTAVRELLKGRLFRYTF